MEPSAKAAARSTGLAPNLLLVQSKKISGSVRIIPTVGVGTQSYDADTDSVCVFLNFLYYTKDWSTSGLVGFTPSHSRVILRVLSLDVTPFVGVPSFCAVVKCTKIFSRTVLKKNVALDEIS